MTIRQTFVHEIQDGYPLKHAVPAQVRAQLAVQDREFAARELAREGYSDGAIAEALRIDVKAVKKLIGADS